MKFYLAILVCAVAIALPSYQPAFAGGSTFVSKSINNGDNLLSILRRWGFSDSEREKVLAADAGLRRIFLTLDTKYLVRQGGGEIEMHFFDSQTSDAFIIKKNRSQVSAYRYKPNFKVSILRVQGRIVGSLLGSALEEVPSNWVASRFADAYAFELSGPHGLKRLQRGAKFWFTVEKKYEGNNFVKYGEVIQTSLELNGRPLQKRFMRFAGGGVFLNSTTLLIDKPMYSPVNYIKIASTFQPNRLHPITHRRQPHLGVDFELPLGAPVMAPKKGIVLRLGKNHASGNFVVLQHANGMQTAYNHLYKIDRKIHPGLKVNAGDILGEVGCTGYCTRAHLHFAVKINNQMVNPLKYIKPFPAKAETELHERVATN
jgi:murein DD-endopeptidase MepM/ murein hydrolase activator NlpD